MSELKRYTCLSGTAMVTSEDGEYVDYEDADKEIATKDAELARLRELILHIWVHDGYENCGYKQMTTEQKQLYDEITNHNDS